MLTASRLARYRALMETLLPDTATILHYSSESDGAGGVLEEWGGSGSGSEETVAARITHHGGGEPPTNSGASGIRGDRADARTSHIITLPHDTQVTAQDRIVHGGVTYEVLAVRTRSWELIRRVEVKIAQE